MLNVQKYLERISYQGEIQTNLNTLAALHRHHILSIPFENLDIHYGRKIILDLNRIEQKVITHHRGGFCYELNGLFGALLRELGFDVKLLSARVFGNEKIGPLPPAVCNLFSAAVSIDSGSEVINGAV